MSSETPDAQQQRRSVIEHEQSEQATQDFYSAKDRLQDLIQNCSRALGRGDDRHYAYVTKRIHQVIIPELEDLAGKRFIEYDTDLNGNENWNYPALAAFQRNTTAILQTFLNEGAPALRRLNEQAAGYTDGDAAARRAVEGALGCCVALAEHKDVVMSSYSKEADAVGFSGLKLGHHLQRGDMDFGDPVEAITDELGKTSSLYSGSPGTGKSTGSERQLEDFYRLQEKPGPDVKCIDLADFTSAENIFYDIPQQQQTLRDVRTDDYDLPADFTEIDGYEPKMEVYIPLTPNLDQARLPYDTEREEFVPKYFTIPAASITKELFVSVVTSRVSKGEKNTIRNVYESVDRDQEDWTLNDMVRELVSRDELSEKHKKNAIRAIRSLQDMGFIRREDEHTIDWEEIFTTPDVITVFNQSHCTSGEAKLFCLAWLLEHIWEERRYKLFEPEVALLIRELWEIVPHTRRDSDSEIESALQERIGTLLTRLQRKIRDIRGHLIGDTQQIMDLHKGVRELFNRYVVYSGDDTTVENIYSWTSNDEWWRFSNTLNLESGVASIVGMVGPAISDKDKTFVGPVRMTPPSFHHHSKSDGPGWYKRVDFVDTEELRTPSEWPTEIPEDLEVGSPNDYEREETGEMGDPDQDRGDFIRYHARTLRKQGVSIGQIQGKIENNPDTGNPYSKSTVHGWVEDIDPNAHQNTDDTEDDA